MSVLVATRGARAADTEASLTEAQVDDAASLGVELTYDAPTGCGDEHQVLRRTQQLLGGPKPRGEVKAAIVVRLVDAGVKLDYEATREGAQSKRDLVVTDCAAAVEASALLLMLTLDPVAAARAAALQAEGAADASAGPAISSSAPADETAVEAPSAPPVKPRPRQKLVDSSPDVADGVDPPELSSALEFGDTWVGVAGELVTALAPNLARGLRLDVGTTVSNVRLGVWGSYDGVSPRSLPQAPFATVESQLFRLRLWGGPTFRSGAVQFGPLLAFGAEHLRAEVAGISSPVPGAMTWLSGALGGHFDVHLTQSLALRVQASAVFSLERRSFTVRGIPGLVHQPRPVGGEGAAGLLWVWGAR